MGPCLHHTHHFPLSLCQPCICFHREAGRDVYIPLLGTTSAASDSLPLTEAQAPVSSSQTEYPTTSENYHIPHPTWTVAHQAPLSMEFSRKEYWSGLPFPSQGIFPTQGSNPSPPHCRLFTTWATRKALGKQHHLSNFQTVSSSPPYWGFSLSYSDPNSGSAGLTPRPYTQCGQGTAYKMHFSDVKPESRVIKWPIKATQPTKVQSLNSWQWALKKPPNTIALLPAHHVASSKASGLQSVLPQSRQQLMQSDSPLALTTHSLLHPSSSTTKQLFAFWKVILVWEKKKKFCKAIILQLKSKFF